jgi:hypothetical protein
MTTTSLSHVEARGHSPGEAIVYGIAEGLLLATLPVLVLAVWQVASAAGWTEGGWEKVAPGAMAIVGSLLVILVHHLGYAEFRQQAVRAKANMEVAT